MVDFRLRQRGHLRQPRRLPQLGGKVVAMSDSNGYDRMIRERHRPGCCQGDQGSQARPHQGVRGLSSRLPSITRAARASGAVKCDIALPCATQNELDAEDAKALVANGVHRRVRRAPTCPPPSRQPSISRQQRRSVRARQGRQRRRRCHLRSGNEPELPCVCSWTFEEVDAKLNGIMVNIYHNACKAAEEYGMRGQLWLRAPTSRAS